MKIKTVKGSTKLSKMADSINEKLPKDYRVKNKVYIGESTYIFFIKRENKHLDRIDSSVIVRDGGNIILPKILQK